MTLKLTDDEVSALIEACNVADSAECRPRPPWNRVGRSAWNKLISEERRRCSSSEYGQCPQCGAECKSRERRLGGNDTCHNGHVYPSSTAVR